MSKGLLEWVKTLDVDVCCFQELKANIEDINKKAFEDEGFHTYWFSAKKKGYSGVGVISKIKPDKVVYGCGLKKADDEGRVLQVFFKDVVLVNTYFPSGSSGEERQAYKMEFLNDYLKFLTTNFSTAFNFSKTKPNSYSNVIVAGDYNICHQAIDIHDPVGNKNSSGFLPEERAWMDSFFKLGFVDSFRKINKQLHQYSWWSFRANARTNNKGWRIDYINVTNGLESKIKDAYLLPQAIHSDHCPVFLHVDV